VQQNVANGAKGLLTQANKGFPMPKKSNGAVQTAAALACGNAHDHILTIDVVAKMFRVSTWTLRLYEWRGLIQRERTGDGAVFSWRDCERIALIVKAKKAGLAIRQIAPIVKAMNGKVSRDILQAGHRRCRDLIAATSEYNDAVAEILAEFERIAWELSKRLSAGGSDRA
jgi:DNA-binding transcriptional MerR regulator